MKKFIITLLLISVIALLFIEYNKTNEYTIPGTIKQVTNEHWIIVETEDGHLWEFDGYGYSEQEKVMITFNSADTPQKIDDVIMNVTPIK